MKRNGVWTNTAVLTATDEQVNDAFGSRVLLSGDGTLAFVGALSHDYRNRDSVYVFV